MATPTAEIDIDEALIGRLIAAQVPELTGQSIRIVAHGWDNVVARIGEVWMARLPRRALAAPLVLHEQCWLPVLAPRLPLPIPVPVHAGAPMEDFPWPWSVGRWLPGRSAAEERPSDPRHAARTLAGFVRALHQPAPADAPANPLRGVALERCAEAVERRVAELGARVDPDPILALWRDVADSPPWSGLPCWLHGDLHPANLLTLDGQLSAVLDFGDLTAGDPATDLAVAWMMFGPDERSSFRAQVGVDGHTWRRAAGWALHFSLAYLTSDETTAMPAIGRVALSELLDEMRK
ncbi:MAG: aminoglycoside phosphotransferase family protein [Deltaproteobacteria bacterium]|nr:aminoglycoside phosphotransferase family protein [Deltaproteobacteria bacterium]